MTIPILEEGILFLFYLYWCYLLICYVTTHLKWVPLFLSALPGCIVFCISYPSVYFCVLVSYVIDSWRTWHFFNIINHLLKYKSSECTCCKIMKHSINSSYWVWLPIITDTVPSTKHHSSAAQTFTSTLLYLKPKQDFWVLFVVFFYPSPANSSATSKTKWKKKESATTDCRLYHSQHTEAVA